MFLTGKIIISLILIVPLMTLRGKAGSRIPSCGSVFAFFVTRTLACAARTPEIDHSYTWLLHESGYGLLFEGLATVLSFWEACPLPFLEKGHAPSIFGRKNTHSAPNGQRSAGRRLASSSLSTRSSSCAALVGCRGLHPILNSHKTRDWAFWYLRKGIFRYPFCASLSKEVFTMVRGPALLYSRVCFRCPHLCTDPMTAPQDC